MCVNSIENPVKTVKNLGGLAKDRGLASCRWALGQREIADLKAKLSADAEAGRGREAHLEEKLTLKDARA